MGCPITNTKIENYKCNGAQHNSNYGSPILYNGLMQCVACDGVDLANDLWILRYQRLKVLDKYLLTNCMHMCVEI
jgi:hypothetical protein